MPASSLAPYYQSRATKLPHAGNHGGTPLVQRFREEFRQCGGTAEKPIAVEGLSRRWLHLAEEEEEIALRREGVPAPHRRVRGHMEMEDMQVLALRASQSIQDMDLTGSGSVSEIEWVHYMSLLRKRTPTLKPEKQINEALKAALRQHANILSDLQHMFELADESKVGCLSFDNIYGMYIKRCWHLSPLHEKGYVSDEELLECDPRELATATYETMRLTSENHVSYAEFMAYCFGRRKTEVSLNVYDLSNGVASSVSPWVVGQQLEGVWHTGIVAFGKEYYFGGDIFFDAPQRTAFGKPTKVIMLGKTLWRQEEFHNHIVEHLRPVFNRTEYDIINHNCNHFSETACQWLTGLHIPTEVLRQSENLMALPTIQMVRPLLNRWLGRLTKPGQDDAEAKLAPDTEVSRARAARTFKDRKCSNMMPTGMVVSVRPPDNGDGCKAMLGTVCSPREQPETVQHSSADGEIPKESAWVRYLGITPTSASRGYRVALRTECVPRDRICAGKLEDVGGATKYHQALQAILGVVHSRRAAKKACEASHDFGIWRGGASYGLKPSALRRPQSCHHDDADDDADDKHMDDEPLPPSLAFAHVPEEIADGSLSTRDRSPGVRHLHLIPWVASKKPEGQVFGYDEVAALTVGIDARATPIPSAPPLVPNESADTAAVVVDAVIGILARASGARPPSGVLQEPVVLDESMMDGALIWDSVDECDRLDVPAESRHSIEEPIFGQPLRAAGKAGRQTRCRSESRRTSPWKRSHL